MTMPTKHKYSSLKQQNKKHNVLGHRTKGQLAKLHKGRVAISTVKRKAKRELSRKERKLQIKHIREQKRDEAKARKRSLGTANQPPFLVTVVPLDPEINPRKIVSVLTACDPGATVTSSAQGVIHLSSPRYKQRFSFIIPPINDLYAILDSVKASNTLMLLWPADDELSDAAELLVSSVLAQGLPTPVHVTLPMDDMGQKRKIQVRQRLTREIESKFAGTAKLFCVENDQEALLLLRYIGAQKQRPVYFKDNRPHLLAEKVEFEEKGGATGTLKVHGYIRGQPLSVNSLVHIPGWGDFQMSHIYMVDDPHPLELRGKNVNMSNSEPHLIEEADPEKQELLISTNEVDPMEGEQTWPSQEELDEADENVKAKTRTKRVPKGTSDYQAAWILDSEDEEGSGEDDDDDDSQMDNSDLAPVDVMSQYGCEEGKEDESEDDEEYEVMTLPDTDGANYDEKYNYGEDMDDLERFKAAREDAAFPDEIDTPMNIPSRIRFQKYRGLQSFRTSTWDPYENLPLDYARIFQFRNFFHTKNRLLKEEREGALPGWYVIVHIQDVPRHLYDSQITSQAPLVVFGLLPHEQKMSVMNVAIKSHPMGHFQPIKSKDRLIFHIGFRRFANCPIFSEHSTGNKHKFARYFHPGTTVVASMFAPITFPPVSALVFRERPGGAQDLIATGSLYDMNPKRIVTKRVVLSGFPFKINRKSAVIRHMFFNREDVLWFKPIELRTKWGRRGHIKEALGTHGHMKCQFDGKLKAQDTVLLNLYKRMFPKWTFDPHVAHPPPLYSFKNLNEASDESSDEAESEQNPPVKKAKKVHFQTSRQ